jgi:pimeloyl-ACP methyl ester carboxylesterase
MSAAVHTRRLVHARIELALHLLREGEGRALLLLHGLGERSPQRVPEELAGWPGPVAALDFTGHGASSLPHGGGYTAELLMADADTALRALGPATVVGRGLGAYVALLLAGARPQQVRGTILRDGLGLAGGGPRPGSPGVLAPDGDPIAPPDPLARAELSRDLRPPDYATSFVRQAAQLSGLARPISVCCIERPDWLVAVVEEPGVEETDLAEALALYARSAGAPGSS